MQAQAGRKRPLSDHPAAVKSREWRSDPEQLPQTQEEESCTNPVKSGTAACISPGPLPVSAAAPRPTPSPIRPGEGPSHRRRKTILNQTTPTQPDSNPGKSGVRVATRDLVTIGQLWRRRSRKRPGPLPVRIYQVHRADRSVDVHPVDLDGRRAGDLQRIPFAELREKYVLLDGER